MVAVLSIVSDTCLSVSSALLIVAESGRSLMSHSKIVR